jgi:tRNA pseudouridine38-40 synthase
MYQPHSDPPEKRPITEVLAESSEHFKRVKGSEKKIHSTELEEGPSGPPSTDTKHSKRDAAGWAKSRWGKAKDTKNKGRRRGTRVPGAQGKEEDEDQGPKAPRLPKRQSALLIGFCGTGCNGMQMYAKFRFSLPSASDCILFSSSNFAILSMTITLSSSSCPLHCRIYVLRIRQPDVRTIEGVLFGALVRAGAVSQDNADDPVKVGHLHGVCHVSERLSSFQVNLGRAARTDAGVHAAGNLVSMKLITAIPGVEDFVARINEELPPEIRVWGSVCVSSFSKGGYNSDVTKVRVQNSFNARMFVIEYRFSSSVLRALSQVLRQPQVYLLLPYVSPYTPKARNCLSACI